MASVLKNYTKMLPDQEDAVNVHIEMHLQVSYSLLSSVFFFFFALN